MATTQIAFGPLGGITSSGGAVLALAASRISQEALVPSGTAQSTTVTAGNCGSQPICRIATDTAVYVSFGSAPNASTDEKKLLVPAGAIEYVAVSAGDKASVVNA